jgi:hypothetical protein
MQSFIVLGIIPGTNIQVGFFGWLGFVAILLFARYVIRRVRGRRRSRTFLRNYTSLALATQRSNELKIRIT